MKKILRGKSTIYFISTFLIFFVIWELVVKYNIVNSLFLPSPSEVVLLMVKLRLDLLKDLLITGRHIIISYSIGAISGLVLGVCFGWYQRLDMTIGKIISAIFPIPKITFLPLFIIWFGIGEFTIILTCSLSVFFTLYIYTHSGVKKVDTKYIEVFKNLGGKGTHILDKVILPATLPYITSGLKYAIGRVLTVTIMTEMLISERGLGAVLWRATNLFRPDLTVVIQVIIGILAILLFWFFNKWEKKALPWNENL